MSLIGYASLQKRFGALKDQQALLRELALRGVAEASALAPVKTGNLRRQIHVGQISGDTATVVAGATYSVVIERGSRSHIIVPRNRKVLAWGGPRRLSGSLRSGGQATHFARRVHHPGTRARPFLLPGMQRAVEKAGLASSIIRPWDEAA